MVKNSLNKSATGTPKASPKAKIPKSPLKMTPGKMGRKSVSKPIKGSPQLTELVKEEAGKGRKSLKTPKKEEDESEGSSESGSEGEEVYDSAEEMDVGSVKEPSKTQQKMAEKRAAIKAAKKERQANPTPAGEKKYNLFVGQLGVDITAEDLKAHFSTVATVSSARVPTFRDSGRSRRFGFVQVASQSDYEAALGLHKSHLKGSCITVEFTVDGSKKSEARSGIIKSKTLKLRSLQEQGILSNDSKKSPPAKKTPSKAPKQGNKPTPLKKSPGKKGLKATPKKA